MILYFICIPEWTDSQHLLEVLFSLDPLDSNRRNGESVLMIEWRVINSTKQMGTSGAEYHSDLSKFNVVLMHMVWLTRPDGVIQFGHESINGEYKKKLQLANNYSGVVWSKGLHWWEVGPTVRVFLHRVG